MEGVDFLLKVGADPNLKDDRGWAALHLAASRDLKCICMLLEAGSDIKAKNQYNKTALCCAIECCNNMVIRLLIDNGARIKDCCVNIPKWVRKLVEGRDRCRQATLMLIAIRRFRRSPVLESNPLDISKLIGKEIWSTRMDEFWLICK